MMIKKAHSNQITHLRVQQSRTCALRVVALYDHAFCAHASKTIANIVTYPMESVRLWTLCNEQHTRRSVFAGFKTYLPYCVFNNFATYQVFHHMLPMCANVVVASIMTCIVISCYKVPFNFFLKNKVVGDCVDMKTFFTNNFYIRAFFASLSEDIPDLLLKLALKDLVVKTIPSIQTQVASLIAAIFASVSLCPIELFKTSLLCGRPLILSPKSVFLKILIGTVNMFVFHTSYDFLYAAVVKI